MPQPNCQYTTRYCWEADKVKTLIRLRAELSPLFTGKRNASKYAWAVVERELNVPLPLSKIIKKWNNLLQEYKAIKLSEEPKRREWPFFNLMDVYFSDQVNDPTLRLFSSTKTLGADTLDERIKIEDDPIMSQALAAAAAAGSLMDISDIIQESQNDQLSENNCGSDDAKPETNYPYNNGEGSRDYEDSVHEKSRKNIPHPSSFMHQHHNIAQYLLSWNNFHGNMCKGFLDLQKDEKMVDVTIAAGGKIFKAHKLVLSVCSPYFQKIFLEHPSSHPILFMTDVSSNYMAGLLDFMYSGQVNVKYDDLPNFLKVAEAMQIKGLHTESTNEQNENTDEGPTTGSSIASSLKNENTNKNSVTGNSQQENLHRYQQLDQHFNSSIASQHQQQQQTQQQLLSPTSLSREPSFREHIRSRYSTRHDIMCNNNNNNNNNNTTSNNNNSKYFIHQANTSNKILDSQKYHKYFSKRKMMAQYEEQQNEKKFRSSNDTSTPTPNSPTIDVNKNLNYKLKSSPPPSGSSKKETATTVAVSIAAAKDDGNLTDNDTDITGRHTNSLSQNIKVEPDIIMNQDDNDGSSIGGDDSDYNCSGVGTSKTDTVDSKSKHTAALLDKPSNPFLHSPASTNDTTAPTNLSSSNRNLSAACS